MKLNKITLVAAMALGGLLTLGTSANAQNATNAPATAPAPRTPPIRGGRMQGIDMLAKQLGLSEEQKTNFAAATQERTKKMMELTRDTTVPAAEKGAKRKELQDAFLAKVKDILTPEQYTNFLKTPYAGGRRPMVRPMAPGAAPAPATPPGTSTPPPSTSQK